jgi:transposase-like protein
MTKPRMSLLQLLDKAEGGADREFLRDGLTLLVQELMDAEVTQLVGAGPYERTDTRLTQRNGYREREWDTRVGTMDLQIPKLRQGTYFPGLLEPRRRHERALLSVVQQAYVHGVSTRAVDHLAEALGLKDGTEIRLCVTAKAYSAVSTRQREAVCIAGTRTDVRKPEWIRLWRTRRTSRTSCLAAVDRKVVGSSPTSGASFLNTRLARVDWPIYRRAGRVQQLVQQRVQQLRGVHDGGPRTR